MRRRSRPQLLRRPAPHDQCDHCRRIEDRRAHFSPQSSRRRARKAIAIAKRSFNADSENIRGIGALGFEALALYYNSDEAREGTTAFLEKRRPNFRRKPKQRR